MLKKLVSYILVLTFALSLSILPAPPTVSAFNEVMLTTDDATRVTRSGSFGQSEGLMGPSGVKVKHYYANNPASFIKYSAIASGYQEVFVYVMHYGTTATDVETTVSYNGGETKVVHMDYNSVLQCSATTPGVWVPLGTYYFNGDGNTEFIKMQLGSNNIWDPIPTFRTYAVKFVDSYTGATVTTDNADYTSLGGTWDTSADLNGPDGTGVTHYLTSNKENWVSYSAEQLLPGHYNTFVYVMNDGSAATDVVATIANNGTTTTKNLDFSTVDTYTTVGAWVPIGTYLFKGGDCNEYVRLQLGASSTGALRTYAVKFALTYPQEVVISASDPNFCTRSGEPEMMWGTSTLIGPSGSEEINYISGSREDYVTYSAKALYEGFYNAYVYVLNIHNSTAKDVKASVMHNGNTSVSNLDYKSVKTYSTTTGGIWVCLGKYYFKGGSADEYIKLQLGTDTLSGESLRASSVKFVPSSKPFENDTIIRAGEAGSDPTAKWFTSSTLLLDNGVIPVKYQKKAGSTYKFSAESLDAGNYDVFYYRVRSANDTPLFIDDNKVRMNVNHNGQVKALDIDCSFGGTGWVRIGTFDFAGSSSNEYVQLERLHGTDPIIATYATAIKFVSAAKAEMNKTTEVYAIPNTPGAFRISGWDLGGSSLRGPDGITKSSFVATNVGPGASLVFSPPALDFGLYDVYVYKMVYTAQNDPDLLTTVLHNGKTFEYHLDCTQGTSEYVYLGAFDFAGNGAKETITLTRTAQANTDIASRGVSVKLVGPKIAPDIVNNVIGRDIRLNYNKYAEYNITAVSVNGTPATNYTVDESGLILDGSLFPTAQDYQIVISAEGQTDMTVTQAIASIPSDIIVEASNADLVGTWSAETALMGHNGSMSSFYSSSEGDSAVWSPIVTLSGKYAVYFYNVVGSANADKAIVTVNSNSSISKKAVDIKNGLSGWKHIGEYYFETGRDLSISLTQAESGTIRADAIKLIYIPDKNIVIKKMTLGNYANVITDLSSSVEKLAIESEIYNDGFEAVTAPRIYAATYNSNGILTGVAEIDAVNKIINTGESTIYSGGIKNVTFEEGDYISLYMWGDNLAPVGTQYTNIYKN